MTRLNDLADEIRDLKGHSESETNHDKQIQLGWQIGARKEGVANLADPDLILEALDVEHDKAKRLIAIIRCQSAVLRTIHDRLDESYDVDDYGGPDQREAPFSQAGACLALARIALAKVDPSVPRETAELRGSDVFVYRKVEDAPQNTSTAATVGP